MTPTLTKLQQQNHDGPFFYAGIGYKTIQWHSRYANRDISLIGIQITAHHKYKSVRIPHYQVHRMFVHNSRIHLLGTQLFRCDDHPVAQNQSNKKMWLFDYNCTLKTLNLLSFQDLNSEYLGEHHIELKSTKEKYYERAAVKKKSTHCSP